MRVSRHWSYGRFLEIGERETVFCSSFPAFHLCSCIRFPNGLFSFCLLLRKRRTNGRIHTCTQVWEKTARVKMFLKRKLWWCHTTTRKMRRVACECHVCGAEKKGQVCAKSVSAAAQIRKDRQSAAVMGSIHGKSVLRQSTTPSSLKSCTLHSLCFPITMLQKIIQPYGILLKPSPLFLLLPASSCPFPSHFRGFHQSQLPYKCSTT